MKRDSSPPGVFAKKPKLEFASRETRTKVINDQEIKRIELSKHDSELIKDRYMGKQVGSRQLSKKIKFGWDLKDDTTMDDPLYDLVVHKEVKKDSLDFAISYSNKSLSEMTRRDWKLYREEHGITLKNSDLVPIRSWKESGLSKRINEILLNLNLTQPTPIQMQAIPIGLEGRDIIGLSSTGSGKTLAFLLPAFQLILEMPPLDDENKYEGPYVLVITPTRELSQQIENYGIQFSKSLGLTCLSVIGGKNMQEQSFKFRDGAHIVIATPGRLLDSLEQGVLSLNQCSMIILDECDKMIDLGFKNAVRNILNYAKCPASCERKKPQMLLFSATLPPDIDVLTSQYMDNPVSISIGTINSPASSVRQQFERVSNESDKKSKLIRLLKSQMPPIIIFVNMKGQSDALVKTIKKLNIPCVSLHGGKSQQQRESAILSFRKKKVDVLITTDVAGRGLDVENIQLVINYDMPRDMTAYTHRIGRTGRNGQVGKALSFIMDSDDHQAIKKFLKSSNLQIPSFLE
eukprot:NODE_1052_length_2432_cov_1.010716.p1 type:complete len:517 gc:universal NODE_1052_length_2432_cov_1.010716:2186-636(-)